MRRRVAAVLLLTAGLGTWLAWDRHTHPPGDAPRPRAVWSKPGLRGMAVDGEGRVLAVRFAGGGAEAVVVSPAGRVEPLRSVVPGLVRPAVLPGGGFAFASGAVLAAWRPGRGVETLLSVGGGKGFGPDIAAVFMEGDELVCGWTPVMLSGAAYTKDYLTWSRWDAATLEPVEGGPPAEWDGNGAGVMRNVRRAEALPRGSVPEAARWVSADFAGDVAAAAWLETGDSRAVGGWRLRTYHTGVRLYRWGGGSWELLAEDRRRTSRLVGSPANGWKIDLAGHNAVRLSPGGRFLLVTGGGGMQLCEVGRRGGR